MRVERDFKRYKLKIEGNKVYDPIRQMYVPLTPEEDVRQRTIKYLINRMKVPSDKIVVERGLNTFGVEGSRKRIDIGIIGDYHDLAAIIECKAYSLTGTTAPFEQAIDYVMALNIPAYFVTDGIIMEGFSLDPDNHQFLKMDSLPMYESLCV